MRSTPRIEPNGAQPSSVWHCGLVLLALVGAAGCPAEPQAPRVQGAGDDTPRSGGTFVFHHETNLDSLDPQVAYNELATMGVRLLFDGLLDYNHDAELIPRIAEGMPSVSEDGRTFRFTLRQGVRFQPMPGLPEGRELVAEDVRYTLLRLLSQEMASPGYAFFRTLEGAEAYHDGEADDIPGIRVTGPYTIEFHLDSADQTFLNAMAMPFAYPVPRENVEHWGDEVGRHPVGAGPMRFVRWERGVQVEFARFEDYFDGGHRPDRMIFLENLQRSTAALRFRNGDIDAIHRQSTQDYLFFKRAPAWQPYQFEYPLASSWGVIMNTELPPFDNVHVRRAVAYGIDGESWARARGGRLATTGQLVPPNVWGFVHGFEGHHLGRERAREELRLAGYENGIPDPIVFTTGEGDVSRIYGELFQADMAAIGITVELRQLAFATYLSESSKPRRVQSLLGGWNMDFPDAASFFDPLLHSDSIDPEHSQNRAFYNNPALDDVLNRARSEQDREVRRGLYAEAARIVGDDAPWAFIFNPTLLEVWQPHVRGYRPHPVWSLDYRQVWLDLPKRRTSGNDATGEGR